MRENPANVVSLDEATKLDKCRKDILGMLKPDKLDIDVLTNVSKLCYSEIYDADALGDFNIRRSNLLRQQFEGRIVLWMVVAITLSGVLLAGLQLFAAFLLAASGHGDLAQTSELSLEQKKISLKSSVTGLLILTVSFAFFIVYVLWVYTIKEQKQDFVVPAKAEQQTIFGVGNVFEPSASGAPNPAIPAVPKR